jgi:hypothetical protein
LEYKNLRPSQILLDPDNPRLPDGTSNDKEAINRLLAEGYGQMLALARDLADRGEGNPSELPIVMKDGTKYVVLEGNRRFAALKLLGDPKLADDPEHQAAFIRVKNKGKQPPKALYCAVAESRNEADPWLTLRHTGANDGVGVRVWSPEQTARHRRRMKAPVDSGTLRAIAIADELTEAYQVDADLVGVINKVRAERLTNIGRFFSGTMLTRMQFQMRQVGDEGTQALWVKHTAEQLRDFFRWAFEFLDTHTVDAFKNDALRDELLNKNSAVVPSAADSMPEHRRIVDRPYNVRVSDKSDANAVGSPDAGNSPKAGDSSGGGSGSGDGESPSANADQNSAGNDGATKEASSEDNGRRRDLPPERTLYSKVKLPNLSSNIQRLLREAKQLVIDENYATACVLARVILELAVSDGKVLSWSGKKEGDPLAEKIRGCILKLDPFIESPRKRTRQDLTQAHIEASGIGVVYLHQFMHNPSAKSDPHLARRFSSAYSPLLNSINEAVK